MSLDSAMESISRQAARSAEEFPDNRALMVQVEPVDDEAGTFLTVAVATAMGGYLVAEATGISQITSKEAEAIGRIALWYAGLGFDLQGKRSRVALVSYHSAPQCIQ
ncbi:hypothetical protein M0G74_10995 [Microbulbifer sp. CAU 1566]|uniref:hypothetical protein n=1 Tax=Microbulbifer sp. CAU 1566 TaxID=2933269 RepID=UPI0020064596|nr:hypothetical protein [Microbulbifer sp. CAU 1566]MCK7597796.1 hypothetical protein [Microbulbifer sp. CAU 1566]